VLLSDRLSPVVNEEAGPAVCGGSTGPPWGPARSPVEPESNGIEANGAYG
jgi:hypothetical protein